MSNILGKSVADIIVDDNEFAEEPLIAPGLHAAVITSISEGTSQAGDDFCKIHFEITGGQNAGVKVADFLGWTTDVRAQISDKKLKSLLTICGVNGPLQSYDQLCMKPLQINNKIYNGKDGVTRNSINYYRGPAQYAAQPQVTAPAQNIPQPTWGQQPAPAPAPQPAMPQMPQQPMQPQVPVQQPPAPQQQVQPQMMPQQQVSPQPMQAQQPVQQQMPAQNFDPNNIAENPPW